MEQINDKVHPDKKEQEPGAYVFMTKSCQYWQILVVIFG